MKYKVMKSGKWSVNPVAGPVKMMVMDTVISDDDFDKENIEKMLDSGWIEVVDELPAKVEESFAQENYDVVEELEKPKRRGRKKKDN